MPKLFLCSCHFPLSLTTKLSVSLFLPFPTSPFSFNTLFLSIHLLHCWTYLNYYAAQGWWMYLISHLNSSGLKLFVYFARAVLTRSRKHVQKHTHSIPPCTLNGLETYLPWEASQEATRYLNVSKRRRKRGILGESTQTFPHVHSLLFMHTARKAQTKLSNRKASHVALILSIFPLSLSARDVISATMKEMPRSTSKKMLCWHIPCSVAKLPLHNIWNEHKATTFQQVTPHQATVMHKWSDHSWDFHINIAWPQRASFRYAWGYTNLWP